MASGRLILAVLSVIAALTLAIPAAYAGGGMGAGSGVTSCRLILNGPQNEPQQIKVIDGYTGGDTVKVGALTLLCDLPALASTVNNPPAPPTNLPAFPAPPNSISCYALSSADAARINATLMDAFTTAGDPSRTATNSIAIGALQLICVPALVTQ